MDIKREKITIDATDQSMGRLASKIAMLLMGKTRVDYQSNIDSGAFVTIENASKIKFTGNKVANTIYYRHTGYVGNLKSERLRDMLPEKIDKILRQAVNNMLPKNKLRAKMIARLKINK